MDFSLFLISGQSCTYTRMCNLKLKSSMDSIDTTQVPLVYWLFFPIVTFHRFLNVFWHHTKCKKVPAKGDKLDDLKNSLLSVIEENVRTLVRKNFVILNYANIHQNKCEIKITFRPHICLKNFDAGIEFPKVKP